MRLTNQLKAQASSLKFASQIPTKTNFILNNQVPNHHDLSKNDGQSKPIVSNDNEENSQSLTVKFKTVINNCENYEKKMNNKQKVPTIVTTSQSENCFYNEKYKLKLQRYNYDDNDSLNSNPVQDEDVML